MVNAATIALIAVTASTFLTSLGYVLMKRALIKTDIEANSSIVFDPNRLEK